MAQVYPDEGLVRLLRLVADNAGAGLTWALFESDTEVSLDSVLTDFTLSDASWGKVVLTESDFDQEQVMLNNGAIQAPMIVFTNTTGSSKTIFGFVIADATNALLIAASRDPAAPVTVINGGTYEVRPILGDYSDTSVPTIDGGTF